MPSITLNNRGSKSRSQSKASDDSIELASSSERVCDSDGQSSHSRTSTFSTGRNMEDTSGQHDNMTLELGEDEAGSDEIQEASDEQSSPSNGSQNIRSYTRESSLSQDSVKIEIRDYGHGGSNNFTTNSLRMCKQEVLKPYWNLLTFVGWRAFNKDSVFAQGLTWRIVNILYTSFVMLILLYSYSYEVLACEWKLSVDETDVSSRRSTTTTTTTTTSATTTEESVDYPIYIDPDFPVGSMQNGLSRSNKSSTFQFDHDHPDEDNPACYHIVTTYLIPGFLHILAYVIGFYYFRIQENEQLDALMEKVFIQATTVQARAASQQNMIKTQRHFLTFGGLWVVATGLLQCLYLWAFDFPTMPLFKNVCVWGKIITSSLEILGRTIFNSVILAIVVNFVTQCEMINFYVRGLVMRLREKSTDLKTAMKDILMLRQSLSQLNGIISKMTSLAGIILAELSVIGLFLLLQNDDNTPKMWAYRALFPLAWSTMLAFPLYQAARVNSICERIKKVSTEMRVFGYKGASLLDLDSFTQFVHHTKLKAKLFHITMLPSRLIFTLIALLFIILVLVQTGNFGPERNTFI